MNNNNNNKTIIIINESIQNSNEILFKKKKMKQNLWQSRFCDKTILKAIVYFKCMLYV